MCGFLKCLQCFGADRYWNTKVGSAWALPASGSGSTKEIVEVKNFNSMCFMLPQTYVQGTEVSQKKEFLIFSGKEGKESFLEDVLSKMDFTR